MYIYTSYLYIIFIHIYMFIHVPRPSPQWLCHAPQNPRTAPPPPGLSAGGLALVVMTPRPRPSWPGP